MFSGTWLALWARLQLLKREGGARRGRDDRIWGQLGWFSGLVCAGSVAGCIAWGAFTQNNAFVYEANANTSGVTDQQTHALYASTFRWAVVLFMFYPVEFLCLIIAKLMLLDRLSNHAYHNFNRVNACNCIGEYTLEKLHRFVSATVVLCSVAGMIAMFAAAAFFEQAAAAFHQAAASCDAQGNDTNSSLDLQNSANNLAGIGGTATSVQNALEAIVLVVMIAAYMVFIPVCVSIFGRAQRRLVSILGHIEYKLDDTTVVLPAEYIPQAADGAASVPQIQMRCDKGKELLGMTLAEATRQGRRFVAACAIVLVTFFVRASFDLLNAYSAFNDPQNLSCDVCEPCQSDPYLVEMWLLYTPEFQSIVVALSSPLPLVISLWLMMTKEDRMLLFFPGASDHAHPLLAEQKKVVAARQNMAIDLL